MRKATKPHVFIRRMIDGRVTSKLFANQRMLRQFISDQMRLAIDCL
jgi:hypothetical protein